MNYRIALACTVRVVRIGKLNRILLSLADKILELFLNDIIAVENLGGVELGLILDGHPRASVDGNGVIVNVNTIPQVLEVNGKFVIIREICGVAPHGIILYGLVTDRNRDIRNIILAAIDELGRHGIGQFVREDVFIVAIGVDITRNRTDEFVIDPIVHSRVSGLIGLGKNVSVLHCHPIFVLVIHNSLVDGRNAGLLGNHHIGGAHNGINRRSGSILVVSFRPIRS